MASQLQAEREVVAGILSAAGLPVTLNPASTDFPGVIVDVPEFTRHSQLGDCVTVAADIPIWVVSPQPGSNEQLAVMLDLAERVLVALPASGGPDAVDSTQFDRGAESPLPALRMTVTRHVTLNPQE